MDYHLDKKITFNGNPEHNSLYKWCLNEIDTSGAKIGRDLIPWNWSLYFTGSSLQLLSEVTKDKHFNDKYEEIPSTTFKNKNAIVGVFHSGICRDASFLTDEVSFFMMGTDRKIKDFGVYIVESSDGNEDCNIYGSPSYDYEVDFSEETEPDYLQLYISLRSDKFAKIAEAVEAKKIDSATLRISGVSGFYSDWSPSISTHYIKVLTGSHKIEGNEESQIEIPLVGKVNEFSLTLKTLNRLNVKPDSQKFDFEKAFKEPELDSDHLDTILKNAEHLKDDSLSSAVNNIESTHLLINKVISKLKLPLWFIFGVLVLILLK